jgi:hypothetical protein
LLCLGGHEWTASTLVIHCAGMFHTDTCRPCGCKRANLPDQIGLRYSLLSSLRSAKLTKGCKALPGGSGELFKY